MKNNLRNSQADSFNINLSKQAENKENNPDHLNRIKVNNFNNYPKNQSIKIGHDIKNKIHKIASLEQNQLTTKNGRQMIDSQITKSQSSLSRSVTFNDLSNCSTGLNKHNGKKSILKKSQISFKNSPRLSKSQISSTSQTHNLDQSIENLSGNKIIKEKYERFLRNCQNLNKQYVDQVYPPIKSSLYLNHSLMKTFCEMLENEGRCIEWMRIGQLFSKKQLSVWNTELEDKSFISKGYITKSGGDGDYLAAAFNMIRDKNSILQKMFESQVVNSSGIYYVKIHQTQTNVWKYVIVDDYIPVIINKKLPQKDRYRTQNILSAFISVNTNIQKLQIWPFLLQKAYAKYYSTYDALGNGYTLDFIQQITGILLESQQIKQNLENINKVVKNPDTILIAEDKKGIMYPMKLLVQQKHDKNYIILDRENNFCEISLKLDQFLLKFTKVHYGFLHKYFFTANCYIRQENIKKKANANNYILRHFSIQESTDCQIGIIQKEQRFYRSFQTYQYSWIRVILVQKQSSGFRWIESNYSREKSLKLSTYLKAGNYIVIIIPEWAAKGYDLNLMFYGNTSANIQRKQYQDYNNIIQDSCMDLAQRFGKLVQVNKNLCSYHFIEKKIGFVIENINNQKEHGQMKVVRSIQGLQKYSIQPLNQEFKNKKTIQVFIKKGNHYTVVLMTKYGVQKNFLEMFDFGF